MAEQKGNAAKSTHARRFDYPEKMTEDDKKKFKHETLMKNPEVLYEDIYQTGIRCNLIFFTRSGGSFKAAIEAAYPGSKCIQMTNKRKLELSDGGTVSVFPSGKIMIQGTEENLKTFEEKFDQLRQDADKEEMKKKLEEMKIEETDSKTEQGEQKQSK